MSTPQQPPAGLHLRNVICEGVQLRVVTGGCAGRCSLIQSSSTRRLSAPPWRGHRCRRTRCRCCSTPPERRCERGFARRPLAGRGLDGPDQLSLPHCDGRADEGLLRRPRQHNEQLQVRPPLDALDERVPHARRRVSDRGRDLSGHNEEEGEPVCRVRSCSGRFWRRILKGRLRSTRACSAGACPATTRSATGS